MPNFRPNIRYTGSQLAQLHIRAALTMPCLD